MRVANNPLLARRHWGTIAEAALALATASAATRLLPFRRYIRLGARPLERAAPAPGNETPRIMDALGRRAPFRAVCLQQAIALQWMLRRRGIDAILHYGVQMPRDANKITAHVWVSVDNKVLLGAPQHEHYTEVARYPGSP
jgi:hypothetical protein